MPEPRTISGVLHEGRWYIDAWAFAVEAREQGHPEVSDALFHWLSGVRSQEPKRPWPSFRRAR